MVFNKKSKNVERWEQKQKRRAIQCADTPRYQILPLNCPYPTLCPYRYRCPFGHINRCKHTKRRNRKRI